MGILAGQMVVLALSPGLRTQRQADLFEVKASLVYRVSSRVSLYLKKETKQQQQQNPNKQANKQKNAYRAFYWFYLQATNRPSQTYILISAHFSKP